MKKLFTIALIALSVSVTNGQIVKRTFVTANGKQIVLTAQQIAYLKAHGANLVKQTLANTNDIRNNEAADQIFAILKIK